MKTPNPQLLHFTDPYCLDFEAEVVEQFSTADGRTGVVLDRTYFYPTGGGQEHDLGYLADRPVLEVYKDEPRGATVHVVSNRLADARVLCRIDPNRRRRHMQHHTAQHLLSGCFVEQLQLETLSANINGDTPSTLDLDGPEPTESARVQVERRANEIIWEDRPVKTFFTASEKLDQIPLRKPPKVTGEVRIVEIDGLDWSACGGTHVARTGAIGMVKIVRVEKVKDKTRIHFVAGERALELFQLVHGLSLEIAGKLSTGLAELPDAVERLGEQLRAAQRELERLTAEALAAEASRLYAAGEEIAGRRLILAVLAGRSMNDLRGLGRELRSFSTSVSMLVSPADDGRAVLVTACAEDSGLKAGELLRRLLPIISGKGGGDAALAQGGGIVPTGGLELVTGAARTAVVELCR